MSSEGHPLSRREIRDIWAIERGTLRACLRVIDETAGLDHHRWRDAQEALLVTRNKMRLAALAWIKAKKPKGS